METIFGSSMASGRFAVGSSEALGTNNDESVATKIEGTTFTTTPDLKQATTDRGWQQGNGSADFIYWWQEEETLIH
jgi:hypothetical protein